MAIPAGEFRMGDENGASWERPARQIALAAFEIAARPVTNAQFRAFRPAHRSSKDNSDGAPVTDVSWTDANAYCAWLAARLGRTVTLPTEAQWERAARGGLEGKRYPWGDEPPVGAERANAFGFVALAWNLWEWTADWYDAEAYSRPAAADPRGPLDGLYRVLRGGGYRLDPASATVFNRGSARPATASERITFRVAAPLAAAPAPTVTSAPPVPAPVPVASTTRPAPSAPPAPAPPAPSAATGANSPSVIQALEYAEATGQSVVAVRTTGATSHKTFALRGPDRIVIDVSGALPDRSLKALGPPSGSTLVRGVRFSLFQPSPPVVRVVIDLSAPANHRVETAADGLRIVVEPR